MDKISYKSGGIQVECDLFSVIEEKDTRKVGKSSIISYNGCKKIAEHCAISIKQTPIFLVQPSDTNLQQHIRWIWMGYKWDSDMDNWEFVEWEASQLNTWQLVNKLEGWKKHDQWTKVDSQFKSAMAYKRAYCKWVLKLAWLIGVYSVVEAPVFENTTESIDYKNL